MRVLLRMFPRRFRRRYGEELLDLVRAQDSRLRDVADLAVAGAALRVDEIGGRVRRAVRLAGAPAVVTTLAALVAASTAGVLLASSCAMT